jgi:NADH dehydrogenase FAD-containing subunit
LTRLATDPHLPIDELFQLDLGARFKKIANDTAAVDQSVTGIDLLGRGVTLDPTNVLRFDVLLVGTGSQTFRPILSTQCHRQRPDCKGQDQRDRK